MSTDWNRYSTPEQTKEAGARAREMDPSEFAVAALQAGKVRSIPKQVVEHTPRWWNRAHTDVFGDKDENEVRANLARVATVVLPLE